MMVRGQPSRHNFHCIQYYEDLHDNWLRRETTSDNDSTLALFFAVLNFLSSVVILNMDRTLYISLDVSFFGSLARKSGNNLLSLLLFFCEILLTLNPLQVSVYLISSVSVNLG